MPKPNVLFLFGDQWRKQALGYAGDPNVKTPHLDAFAQQNINMTNAYSGCPVCTPYRASLITGQLPLTHGLFLNDAPLSDDAVSIAQAFASEGYDTAYVGKWHIDGKGRSSYIPPERRQGFDYWKVLECTHSYNASPYYDQDDDTQLQWEGYDAYSQTVDMQNYLKDHSSNKPFLAMLSWGPPHNPYETAPDRYKKMYDPEKIILRDNVPSELEARAREELAGYYAHCSALDECFDMLMKTLKDEGMYENTIVVFTSDHGDMISSQGEQRKQRPWAESARIPFLIGCPQIFGSSGKVVDGFIDAPDIMPTLLDLCGIDIPTTVEGRSFADHLKGGLDPSEGCGVVACYHPFGEFLRRNGANEYRAILTDSHTYCKTLEGPWLLYNNAVDPFQENNLANNPNYESLQVSLNDQLDSQLTRRDDTFEKGDDYIKKWNYSVDSSGTMAYGP